MAESQSFPGRLGPHTGAAYHAMKDGKPGDRITPEEMTRVMGKDCTAPDGAGRNNVRTAIRNVESDCQVVWDWSRAEKCWVCLDSESTDEKSERYTQAARRRVRRAIRIASSVERSQLNDDRRRQHDLRIQQLGLMDMAGSPAMRHRIEKHGNHTRQPSIDEVARLMGKNGS